MTTKPKRYRLTWSTVIPAVSPRRAAERAMITYFDPSARHLVFNVTDSVTGEETTVDLNQDEEDLTPASTGRPNNNAI